MEVKVNHEEKHIDIKVKDKKKYELIFIKKDFDIRRYDKIVGCYTVEFARCDNTYLINMMAIDIKLLLKEIFIYPEYKGKIDENIRDELVNSSVFFIQYMTTVRFSYVNNVFKGIFLCTLDHFINLKSTDYSDITENETELINIIFICVSSVICGYDYADDEITVPNIFDNMEHDERKLKYQQYRTKILKAALKFIKKVNYIVVPVTSERSKLYWP